MAEPQRIALLEDDTVLSDSGTKTMDIDLRDPISELEIYIRAANYSDGNQANHVHDRVTKVELVDGSEVLWSLSMVKGQALNFWENQKPPIQRISEWPSDGQADACHIRFGRNDHDRELAFLADRFLNPQLKVTWDLGAVRSCGSTSFITGTGMITVIAKTNPYAKGARGFLMTKDLHSWETVGAGDESVDLPRDFPYRLLVVRSHEAGNDFRENINKLKLTCDQDKDVIFNVHPDRLSEWLHTRYGMAEEGGRLFRMNSDDVYTHIWEPIELTIGARRDYDYWHYSHYWSGKFMLRAINVNTGVSPTADQEGWYGIRGMYPHCSLAWPFGDTQNIEEWFDPRPYGSVKLKCSQAQSGAAASVILQQLRPY